MFKTQDFLCKVLSVLFDAFNSLPNIPQWLPWTVTHQENTNSFQHLDSQSFKSNSGHFPVETLRGMAGSHPPSLCLSSLNRDGLSWWRRELWPYCSWNFRWQSLPQKLCRMFLATCMWVSEFDKATGTSWLMLYTLPGHRSVNKQKLHWCVKQ